MIRTELSWNAVKSLNHKRQAIRTEGSQKRMGRVYGDISRDCYTTSVGQGQRVGDEISTHEAVLRCEEKILETQNPRKKLRWAAL